VSLFGFFYNEKRKAKRPQWSERGKKEGEVCSATFEEFEGHEWRKERTVLNFISMY
jgi:hypothetical protein